MFHIICIVSHRVSKHVASCKSFNSSLHTQEKNRNRLPNETIRVKTFSMHKHTHSYTYTCTCRPVAFLFLKDRESPLGLPNCTECPCLLRNTQPHAVYVLTHSKDWYDAVKHFENCQQHNNNSHRLEKRFQHDRKICQVQSEERWRRLQLYLLALTCFWPLRLWTIQLCWEQFMQQGDDDQLTLTASDMQMVTPAHRHTQAYFYVQESKAATLLSRDPMVTSDALRADSLSLSLMVKSSTCVCKVEVAVCVSVTIRLTWSAASVDMSASCRAVSAHT